MTESSGTNPIDILAISAGWGSYHPAKGSVIHRLLERGISTETAARNKSDDWRHRWQCWLSNPLPVSESAPIRRILCFEHGAANAHPAAVVGNVFRALREWMLSVPLTEGIASPPITTFDCSDFHFCVVVFKVTQTTICCLPLSSRRCFNLNRDYPSQKFNWCFVRMNISADV